MNPSNTIIVLFDGVCNLCNGSVQFIIKRDKKKIFRFASLQSDFAKDQLKSAALPNQGLYSIIVLEEGRFYYRSDAVLRILKNLGGIWSLLTVFKILPRGIRDGMYSLIANNRYRFFGQRDECMIPSPEWKDRFLN